MSDYKIIELHGHVYITPVEGATMREYQVQDYPDQILKDFLQLIKEIKPNVFALKNDLIEPNLKHQKQMRVASSMLKFVKKYGFLGINEEMIEDNNPSVVGPDYPWKTSDRFIKIRVTPGIIKYIYRLKDELNISERTMEMLQYGLITYRDFHRIFSPQIEEELYKDPEFMMYGFDYEYAEAIQWLLDFEPLSALLHMDIAQVIGQVVNIKALNYILNGIHPSSYGELNCETPIEGTEDLIEMLGRYERPIKDDLGEIIDVEYDVRKALKELMPNHMDLNDLDGFLKTLYIDSDDAKIHVLSDIQTRRHLIYDETTKKWMLTTSAQSLLGMIKDIIAMNVISPKKTLGKCKLLECQTIVDYDDYGHEYCCDSCAVTDRKRNERANKKRAKITPTAPMPMHNE